MLRILSLKSRVRVGKSENAVVCGDRAGSPARVPRKACVAQRMHVARSNALPDLEPRRQSGALAGLRERRRRSRELSGSLRGFPAVEFRLSDESVVDEQLDE